jgi:predicted anti-sigma-YlaC factor YlaD
MKGTGAEDASPLCRSSEEALAAGAGSVPEGGALGRHLADCASCRGFAEAVREVALGLREMGEEPGADLVERTLAGLRAALAERARRRRRAEGRLWLGLVLIGLLSLPLIVGLNGAYAWAGHAVLGRFVAEPLALLFAWTLCATTLLGLSLAFGALPLLARWGAEVRQGATGALGQGPLLGTESGGWDGR